MTTKVENNIKDKSTKAYEIIYELTFRPRLRELMGERIQGDIWGDLRWIRHSIAHRDAKGVEELKKAKLIKDFAPGQEILTAAVMGKIGQELENWYKILMKYFSPE